MFGRSEPVRLLKPCPLLSSPWSLLPALLHTVEGRGLWPEQLLISICELRRAVGPRWQWLGGRPGFLEKLSFQKRKKKIHLKKIGTEYQGFKNLAMTIKCLKWRLFCKDQLLLKPVGHPIGSWCLSLHVQMARGLLLKRHRVSHGAYRIHLEKNGEGERE